MFKKKELTVRNVACKMRVACVLPNLVSVTERGNFGNADTRTLEHEGSTTTLRGGQADTAK